MKLGTYLSIFCLAICWTQPVLAQKKAQWHNFQKLAFHPSKASNKYYLVAYSTDDSTSAQNLDRFTTGIILESKQGKKITIDNKDLVVTNLGDMVFKKAKEYTLFRFNIVIDNSRSVDSESMNLIQNILTKFIDRLPLSFDAQVIKFSQTIQAKSPFIKDKDQIKQYINQPLPQAGTALYDAIDLAIQELHYSGDDVPFKFSVVLTDGQDTTSQIQDAPAFRDKIVAKCQDNFTPLFIVGVTNEVDEPLLKGFSQGMYYHANNFPDVDRVFDIIQEMIKETFVFQIPAVGCPFEDLKTVYVIEKATNGKVTTLQDFPIH